MKNIFKVIIVFLCLAISFQTLNAQVGINDNNASPDASAMLDVKSTDKGMLIPRMTTSQRDLINTPAAGLMIYNTTTNSFNYYNGTTWTAIGEDNLGNHTATQNIQLGSNRISADGDNEGILISNTGQVGIGKMSTLNDLFQVTKEIPSYSDITTPSTSVTASTFTVEPFHAIDNNRENYPWYTLIKPAWIKFDLGHTHIATSYSIQCQKSGTIPNPNYNFTDWTFEGSNDNTNWTVLDTKSNFTFPTLADTFMLSSPANYQYYRLNGIQSNSGELGLTEFELFGPPNVDVLAVTDAGDIRFNDAYVFPNGDGTSNQTLRTDGSGNLFWKSDFPSVDGTAGQVLTTNGSGQLSWTNGSVSNDNLGNHTATTNLQLNGNYLSNNGGNEGLKIDNLGAGTVVSNSVRPLIIQHNTYGNGSYLEVNNSSGTRALFGVDGNGFSGGDTTDVVVGNWSNGDLALFTTATERIRVTATGEVGIGRTAVTNLFEVNGQASKATAGSWVANSDARLKKNITPLSSEKMLHNLLSLQGVTYEWNDNKTGNDRPTGIQYGFTAQNIQTVFPTLVQKDNLGYLQTAYGTYDAMTVEAIRALNDKIERQDTHIQQLVKEKEALKTQIAKMTQQEQDIAELKAAVQALQGQMEE